MLNHNGIFAKWCPLLKTKPVICIFIDQNYVAMKKFFTLLTLVLLTAFAVKAQDSNTTKADPNAPSVVFSEDTHDFGEITQGDKVSYEFTFKNEGKSDLILKDVKASCGCTTPYWPREAIKAGQNSKITVQFNSTGKSGPFNKAITITSNAGDPTTRIFIKGKINVPAANDGVPERKPSMLNEK